MLKKGLVIKTFAVIALMLLFSAYFIPNVSIGATYTQEVKQGIENFPRSYREGLNTLKKLHPNWTFTAYYTGIDWNELLINESGDTLHKRNVVPSYEKDSWKCKECENYGSWHCASKEAIAYFIDPRNFLEEKRIFQFEELSYNEKVHTLQSIENSVKGTFLENSITYYDEGTKKNITKSYSEIILEAAKITNISPFHIKSKIIQEVGSQGSDSVSGTRKGFEGLYNFFNYGAYDSGNPVENGLNYAREHGWTNPYIAIVEGAKLIGNSYINMGQNTSYFFKFDVVVDKIIKVGEKASVDSKNIFWHQYMTNLMDPYSQSPSVFNMYAANGNLDANLNFIIPVYENMPNEIEDEPEEKILYKIDEELKTIQIVPDADLETILKEQNLTNYSITDSNGKTIEKKDEKIATGYKFNILDTDNKTIKKTYTLIKKGDINGEGKVNSKDAIFVLRYYVDLEKISGEFLTAADVNNDGKVNSKDALSILRFYVDLEDIKL